MKASNSPRHLVLGVPRFWQHLFCDGLGPIESFLSSEVVSLQGMKTGHENHMSMGSYTASSFFLEKKIEIRINLGKYGKFRIEID